MAAALVAVLERDGGRTASSFATERQDGRVVARGELVPELAALLAAAPEPLEELRQWKSRLAWSSALAEPFRWLSKRREEGTPAAEAGLEAGAGRLCLLLHASTADRYWAEAAAAAGVDERLAQGTGSRPAGTWGLPQALAALESVALAQATTTGNAPARARLEALLGAVGSAAGPSDYFTDKADLDTVRDSGLADPHAAAAVALMLGGEQFAERKFLDAGLAQAHHLLERHLDGWVVYSHVAPGDYPHRRRVEPWSAYRSQGLGVQALELGAALGAPWASRARETVGRLRERLLSEGWDPEYGGFAEFEYDMGGGERVPVVRKGRFRLEDQYWALLAFSRRPFPCNGPKRGGR